MAIMGKNQNANFPKPFNGRILISWNLILHKNQKIYHRQLFSLDACLSPMYQINILLNLLSQVLKIKKSNACFCMIASFSKSSL